jgi:hypothetical protein
MAQSVSNVANESPNAALIQMALAYRRSAVLCAAARLGVADVLGDDVRDLDFLAKACQADPDALYRLLRALASMGITEETAPKEFRLTVLGGPLRKVALRSAWSWVILGDIIGDSYSWLTDCVRTGRPASAVRDPNIPTRWSQYPEALSIFHAVMGTAPVDDFVPIAAAWDFSHASVVADLGGGGGSLILAVLQLNQHLRGMLVDLEASIEAARSRFVREDPSSRCRLTVADLTQSVPAGADVYMFKNFLHGFNDAQAIAILKNCRAVIPRSGTVLIIELILPPLVSQADPDLEGHLMSDLGMLAITGGRERTELEWQAVVEAAGFSLTRAYTVRCDALMLGDVGILEAKPVQG